MAFYYKIKKPLSPLNGIQVFETNTKEALHKTQAYDFSNHVLIELLDNITPEAKLWEELGLSSDKSILHKRMMIDSHRVHCRRAIIVCANATDAKSHVQRLSQAKIMKRCVCASVVQDLLFDFKLFEKQISRLGDKRPQHQLLYVTDLNRRREPAVLAQFLRDLFSPFGTVLSVFVSEDNEGFAHPEGVVKFAYLSEAFAAELAYDQFVLGMERLSVTTHHNILLSQCDLRVRLREAQRRHSQTLNSTLSPDSHLFDIQDLNSPENLSHSTDNIKANSFKKSTANQMDIDNSSVVSNGNISLSNELIDVLRNPCESNLMDCLKSMALCSDSSVTRETITDGLSHSSQTDTETTQNSKSCKSSINITGSSMVTLPLKEQDWSTRISSWIANIPSSDFSLSNNVINLNDAVSPMDNASTVCSFKTCHNSTQSNVENPLSSPVSDKTHHSTSSFSDGNETLFEVTSSPASFYTTQDITLDNSVNKSTCTADMSLTCVQSQCSVSNSLSQKDDLVDLSLCTADKYQTRVQSQFSVSNSMSLNGNHSCSHKLSLKNQKLNFSRLSNSQQSLFSTGSFKSQSVHGKPTSKMRKSPVVLLKRLTPTEIKNLCSKTLQEDTINHLKHKLFSSNSDVLTTPSELSDKENDSSVNFSIQRSSRLSSRSSCQSIQKNRSQPELAPKSNRSHKSDSPLRAWLKNDLLLTSNVNVFENVENSRKIVCATADKNVLAHVGCSHMTCDICYPGSTNLLLGCY